MLTIHSKHTICYKFLNSQNSPSLPLSVSPPASLTQLPVPQQPNLLLVDTFVTKACINHFFLHQTQSKHDGNDIIYPKSGFGQTSTSGPSTREVGCVGVG